MYISPISHRQNPNFGITSKVRIPMNDGTTTLLQVTGDVKRNGHIKITKIIGDIMRKGKSIAKIEEFSNKKGFDPEDIAVISEKLGKDAKNPDTVLSKIADSIGSPNPDYNA